MQNRRRFDRVQLTRPLPAKVAGQRAFIIDVSLSGFRIAHQQPLTPGTACTVEFEWEGQRGVIDCRVIRTERQRATGSVGPLYHSGLEMLSAAHPVVRELVDWHVTRALDEQKANARGIPAVAAHSFQTGGGRRFIRHELVGSEWRELPTTDPRQPPSGFTVSDSTSKDEVAMLRESFQQGDRVARLMLQKMAELSISTAEGIPTRKYTP